MADSNRMSRIDEQIKKEVSTIINQELQDPHITGLVSVTKVKTTPDLRYARVFVSMIRLQKPKRKSCHIKKIKWSY